MIARRTLLAGMGAGGGALLLPGCAGDGRYDMLAGSLRAPLHAGAAWSATELARYATLAANSHNSQPWRIEIADDRAVLRPDFGRRLVAVDPDDHHLWCSLGCAAENLAIAARAMGRTPAIAFDARAGAVVVALQPGRALADPLLDAVVQRQSTRMDYAQRTPPAVLLDRLAAAAARDGVTLRLMTGASERAPIKDFVLTANRAQMESPAFVRELRDWIRFDEAEAIARRDGLSYRVVGSPAAPRWIGERFFSWGYTIDSETKKIASWMDNSGGLAMFVADTNDAPGWVAAGRSFQRFALALTAAGLRHAHINMPLEVPATRGQLATHLGLGARRPDLLIRFGYGPLAPWSLRRGAQEVMASTA